jgi:hypothetical protein
MKIYVAGAYTIYDDHALCVEKFDRTRAQLIEAGFDRESIIVPTDIVPEGTSWEDAMFNHCIPSLLSCKAIFLQHDWNKSKGARIELAEAKKYQLDIYYEEHKGIDHLKNIIHLI